VGIVVALLIGLAAYVAGAGALALLPALSLMLAFVRWRAPSYGARRAASTSSA
jgi:hypothetical protein